ncbi:MAG TPA: hypothetical protein VF881_05975 [Polyangiaceae bacterium]
MAWLRSQVALTWLAVTLASACTDKSAPEYVADQFVEAYFRRMDQQAARQFTALGATEMLDRELELTRSVRADGYTAEQAAAEVVYRRTARNKRGERVRFDYDISIKHEDSEEHRAADVELANIQTVWKVVRVEVKAR